MILNIAGNYDITSTPTTAKHKRPHTSRTDSHSILFGFCMCLPIANPAKYRSRWKKKGQAEREMDGQHSRVVVVGWLVAERPSNMRVYLRDGSICSDNFTCCHTETEVADPTFHLTQSQYTDTGPTSPSADPTTPGAWQGSHWSANF